MTHLFRWILIQASLMIVVSFGLSIIKLYRPSVETRLTICQAGTMSKLLNKLNGQQGLSNRIVLISHAIARSYDALRLISFFFFFI